MKTKDTNYYILRENDLVYLILRQENLILDKMKKALLIILLFIAPFFYFSAKGTSLGNYKFNMMPIEVGIGTSINQFHIISPLTGELAPGTAVNLILSANLKHNFWKSSGDFMLSAGLNMSGGYMSYTPEDLRTMTMQITLPLTINATYGLGSTSGSNLKYGILVGAGYEYAHSSAAKELLHTTTNTSHNSLVPMAYAQFKYDFGNDQIYGLEFGRNFDQRYPVYTFKIIACLYFL